MKIICNRSENHFSNVTCKINQLSQRRHSYFVYAELKQNVSIDNNLWVRNFFFQKYSSILIFCRIFQVRVSLFHKGNLELKFRPYIGINNIAINICKFLNGREKHDVLSMLVKGLDKAGNFMHPCPIRVRF